MDGFGDLEPIYAGHATIQQYESIGAAGLLGTEQFRHPLLPAFGLSDRGTPARKHFAQYQPVGVIVIDNQRLEARKTDQPARGNREWRLVADREARGKEEGASRSYAALRPYSSLHQVDHAPRDGQTEPGPAELARRGCIDLRIRGEDQLARILGNPDPGVAHCKPQCTRRFVVGVALDPHDHFTLLGKLDGVPDEVD